VSEILISGLRVETRIGVPDAERAEPQEVVLDVRIEPRLGFDAMGDDIGLTVDYDAVARRIAVLAQERPRRLIETLAAETARMVVAEFAARSVTVEVRKFILPQTDHVAVRFRLEAE